MRKSGHAELRGTSAASVLIVGAVLLLAELTVGGRESVVDAVLHRRESAPIGEDGFQVVVGQVLQFAEGPAAEADVLEPSWHA
jgi:hypothetical protein